MSRYWCEVSIPAGDMQKQKKIFLISLKQRIFLLLIQK